LGRLPDAAGKLGSKGCLIGSIFLRPERYFGRWYFEENRLIYRGSTAGATAEWAAGLCFVVVLLMVVGSGDGSGCFYITVCTIATRHARHAEHKQA
jgi:hypothetical protein